MPIYCVTYDLAEDGKQDSKGLIELLENFQDHFHAGYSTWLVDTTYTAVEIRQYLLPKLDKKDSLMVFKIGKGWATQGPCKPLRDRSTVPGSVAAWIRKMREEAS